jgi:hypothetical protein
MAARKIRFEGTTVETCSETHPIVDFVTKDLEIKGPIVKFSQVL